MQHRPSTEHRSACPAIPYICPFAGTQIASLQMAVDKAKCSVGFKKATKDFEDRIANGTLRVLGACWCVLSV